MADEEKAPLEAASQPKPPKESPFFNAAQAALMPVFKKAPQVSTIYHYTDARGLKGLVDDRVMWFTDVAFLNDASETSYALDLCENELLTYMRNASQGEKNAANALMQRVREVRADWRQIAFCASTEPNLLTQWRDYGQEAVSYSIGLNVDGMVQAPSPSFPIKMARMIYSERTQRQTLRRLFKHIRAVARPILRSGVSAADEDTLLSQAAVELHTLLDWFKNPGFESEKEVRVYQEIFVAIDSKAQALTRASSLGIVPYFAWSPGQGLHLPISHIVVGPSPHGAMGEQAVRILCNIAGLEGVTFNYSTIPWRR